MFRKRIHVIVFHFVVESRDVEWLSCVRQLSSQHCVHINTSEMQGKLTVSSVWNVLQLV